MPDSFSFCRYDTKRIVPLLHAFLSAKTIPLKNLVCFLSAMYQRPSYCIGSNARASLQ
jgi:hypothetical protein